MDPYMTDGDRRAEEDRALKQPITMTQGEMSKRDAYEHGRGCHAASSAAAAYVRSWAGDGHGPFESLLQEIAAGIEAGEHLT